MAKAVSDGLPGPSGVAAAGHLGGETILAVDIGRALTKALLLEPVEGEYRLVALGKAPSRNAWKTEAGVVPSLAAAIRQIERTTGRRFLREGAGDDRLDLADNGIALTTVTSAAPYLPVAVLAVASDVSLKAALEATARTYCRVTAAISTDGDLRAGSTKRWAGAGLGGWEDLQRELENGNAEVVLLAGGHEGGATGRVEGLARAIAEARGGSGRPAVVFAGATGAREAVRRILGDYALTIVDNLAPAPGCSNPRPAAAALDQLFRQHMLLRLPGYSGLLRDGCPDHSAGAIWAVADFLAGHHGIRVLAVDVGSASVALGVSGRGQPARQVLAGRGTGEGAVELLASAGSQAVGRWLQADINAASLHDMVARWAGSEAGLRGDGALADLPAALVRSALRALGSSERALQAQVIVATGGLFAGLPPARAALVLLDGLQPAGVCQLLLDRDQILPALGAVFSVNSGVAASVLLRDGCAPLGLAICPAGVGREGKRWLRLTARMEGGRVVKADLPFGSVARIAAAPGTRLKLELQPASGADLGLGPGEPVAMETVARGLGLLFDCRGRPFEPPASGELRKARLADWQRGVDQPL